MQMVFNKTKEKAKTSQLVDHICINWPQQRAFHKIFLFLFQQIICCDHWRSPDKSKKKTKLNLTELKKYRKNEKSHKDTWNDM